MRFVPDQVIKEHVDQYGFTLGLQLWWRKFFLRKTTSHTGENIFDREWDALIILDGCRVDAMQEIADEYEFISTVDSMTSLGTATYEWMPATFDPEDQRRFDDVAYISGNPFTHQFLDADNFAHLDEVWKYAWNESRGTVPPRPITDRAIRSSREYPSCRHLIHYMQPHTPFLSSEKSPALTLANFDKRAGDVESDWTLIARGTRSKPSVWNDYIDNLRTVLDDVGLLLENLTAEQTIITSDHGNAMGERGIYGHPSGVAIPELYEVPWVETEASDNMTRYPDEYDTGSLGAVKDRLESLGYT